MNGQQDIKLIESYPFAWKEKANEMIKRLNLKTVVKVLPEGICESARVDIGEDKIQITITLRTNDVALCDSATGQQSTYTVACFKKDGTEIEDD